MEDLNTKCSRCDKDIVVYSGDINESNTYSCSTCVFAFGPLSL